jgi:hypothetical protein
MQSLLVGFGKSYVIWWSVELLCLLHTILKQMVLLNVFIGVLSKCYVAIAVLCKISGVYSLLSAS